MNYYQRHIGDYLKDTAHLSLLEHGVYGRLLDIYYSRECGIDDAEAARLVGARSDEERKALETILNEFFVLDGGIWTHSRCDREIEKFRAKAEKASSSARKRWQSEGNANAMRTHSERSANAVPTECDGSAKAMLPITNNQEPITNNQERTSVRSMRATPAAEVCIALKAAGVQGINPSHPRLKALIDAGATADEFVGMADKAAGKSNGFAYLLAAVEGERKRVAGTVIHTGRLPNKQELLEQSNRQIGEEWARKMLAKEANAER